MSSTPSNLARHCSIFGPRANIAARVGTIAEAQNLLLTHLTQGGVFKTTAARVALFAEMNVAAAGPTNCFCNTGHMASLGWFVAHELLGNSEARLYDGSMIE